MHCSQCCEFGKEFQSARLEATKAFGNGALYVEKYLENPRHISGTGRYRQYYSMGKEIVRFRRHQKVIEEAPSLSG